MSHSLNNVDFADSNYESMQMNKGNLTVYLKSWDEREIRIVFFDAIQFVYKLGDGISGLFENKLDNLFFAEALSRCYSEIPHSPPYKCYEIRDLYDFPFIIVVAQEVTVSKV